MKVCIDPGHGGKDPGATYNSLLEKNVVLSVTKYTVEGLFYIAPDAYAISTRTFDEYRSLQDRCDISNGVGVDCFVSIHCNADPDEDEPGIPEAKGEEIWCFKGGINSMRLSKCLANEVDKIFPNEPFRGIKETDKFYVLKHTYAPACLIELGFIDKSSSIETFTNEMTLRRIGGLIARGIKKYIDKTAI